jgi:DNA-binding PadR family transcriptional regulator
MGERRLEDVAAKLDDIALSLDELKANAEDCANVTDKKKLDAMQGDVERAADAVEDAVDPETSARD